MKYVIASVVLACFAWTDATAALFDSWSLTGSERSSVLLLEALLLAGLLFNWSPPAKLYISFSVKLNNEVNNDTTKT